MVMTKNIAFTSVEDLFSRVASHLAGRQATVRLRPPAVSHAMGQVYRTVSDAAVIDVNPNICGDDTILFVFLHEVAHVKNDLGWMPKNAAHARPSGSVTVPPGARKTWSDGRPEKDADAMAERWKAYADKNYRGYERSGYTPLVWKLLALLDYSEVQR